MHAITFGEVFKIDAIQLPNNKFIYKNLITGYRDSNLVKNFINERIGLGQATLNSIEIGT